MIIIAFLINFDICCTMHVTLMKPRSLLSSSIPLHCQCHYYHLNNSIKNKPTTSKKSYRHRGNRWFRSGTLKVEIENHPSNRRLQFSYFFFVAFPFLPLLIFYPYFFLCETGESDTLDGCFHHCSALCRLYYYQGVLCIDTQHKIETGKSCR